MTRLILNINPEKKHTSTNAETVPQRTTTPNIGSSRPNTISNTNMELKSKKKRSLPSGLKKIAIVIFSALVILGIGWLAISYAYPN